MEKIHYDTPMAKAIMELLGNYADVLRRADVPPGACRAFIFGGCALHLHTKARGSNDLDVEFEATGQLNLSETIMEVEDVFFDDPDTGPSSLTIDPNFSPVLGPLHEDYQQNAISLNARETSPLQVFVVEKVDLAISKLGRFGDQDIADIHTLFDHGLCIEHFRSKAREAIDYAVGNRDKLTGNLDQVINLYKL